MSRLTALLIVALLAPSAALGQKPLRPAAGSLVAHDVNDVFLRVSNRGGYGLQLTDPDAGNFPRDTPNRYLFGSGLWIGGIGDVDGNGQPDSIVTFGFHPNPPAGFPPIEFIEGALGFSRDDPIFRVLDTTVPADLQIFPGDPVAEQELFTIYGDRASLFAPQPSIPLGVEVRQRSFAFTEDGLDTAIFFQWDLLNISDRIRPAGYTIRDLWTGIVLDPDIRAGPPGSVLDDTAAALAVDGDSVLLIWDADFEEPNFQNPAGFLAIVPLDNPGGQTRITQLRAPQSLRFDILPVPLTDATEYATLAGIPPRTATFGEPGFDLRALVSWGEVDLPEGDVTRSAAAFVWAAPSGIPPDSLSPLDPTLTESNPLLADLVAAVRAARTAYDARLASLPALLDFPGEPPPPGPADGDAVLQNFPNPFRESTTIEAQVGAAGSAALRVYDLAGREIATLAEGTRDAGSFTVFWDGESSSGIDVAAGVYVVRLETPRGEASIRVLKAP